MVSIPASHRPVPYRPTENADAVGRLSAHLAAHGVPEQAIRALIEDTDPGPCHDLRSSVRCQLDLGHPNGHLAVYTPDPGTKTQTEWASHWTDHDNKQHFAYDVSFSLPDPATPAMRVHTELVDDPQVFICQPVTDTLLYVHIRLGKNDTGLDRWLDCIGSTREQATRTKYGDYLARGRMHGARIASIAHAHSYR